MLKDDLIAIDTETTGLNVYKGHRVFSYSASNVKGETFYLEEDIFRHLKDSGKWTGQYASIETIDNHRGAARKLMIKWMADESVTKVLHNAKFDIKMMRAFGIELKGPVHDTMIMGHVLYAQGEAGYEFTDNCMKRLSLDTLSAKYLDEKKDDGVKIWLRKNGMEFMDKHKRKPNYSDVPREINEPYARTDAFLTTQLFQLFWPAIQKDPDLLKTYNREMELLWHVIDMEDTGFRMDTKFMDQRVVELTKLEKESHKKLVSLTPTIKIRKKKSYQKNKVKLYKWLVKTIKPEEVNFNSDDQMIHVLYKHFKLPILHWTGLKPGESAEGKNIDDLGQPSLDERTLSRLDHPFCKELIRYRQYVKVKDTYYVGYRDHMVGDILHPNYNQAATMTARFSSSDPNLQNIPTEQQVRERAGADVVYKGVKKAFIPRKGFMNFHFDYSGIEMRMFAHLVGTPKLIKAITHNDIHDWATELLYGPRSSMTETRFNYLRVLAKIMNFGILYGMGTKTFMWKLKKTKSEVEDLLGLYFGKLPEVKEAQQNIIHQVEEHGWIKNAFGRKYLIDPRFAYKGMNYFCQGSAADIIKRAMIRVGRYLENKKSGMLMTIHDEIVCQIHESEIATVPKQIVKMMEYAPEFKVPLKVSAEVAVGNWENLKKLKSLDDLCLKKLYLL